MYRYTDSAENPSDSLPYILIDGMNSDVSRFTRKRVCHDLCVMSGAAGIAVLKKSDGCDFDLLFYCSDALPSSHDSSLSPGSDGLREAPFGVAICAVAFADLLGIKAFHSRDWTFRWGETVFGACIDSQSGDCKSVRIFPHSPGSSDAGHGEPASGGARNVIYSGKALCLGDFE